MLKINRIYNMDALKGIKQIEKESISCCITSPPYFSLRDYQTEPLVWDGKKNCKHEWKASNKITFSFCQNETAIKRPSMNKKSTGTQTMQYCSKCGAWKGQLGLEPDFNLYIKHLCDIFDEVKRVLRKDGTLWVNIGDTYASHSIGPWGKPGGFQGKQMEKNPKYNKSYPRGKREHKGVKDKCILQIPSRFAIEMCNRGWILRNEIIWFKRNVLPSSVNDRFTVDFEKIFFFVKNKKYWFEQQLEPQKEQSLRRAFSTNHLDVRKDKDKEQYAISSVQQDKHFKKLQEKIENEEFIGRNKRCVWDITTHSFKDAHFATFPIQLIETPIKAGCPLYICKKCGKTREKTTDKIGSKEVPPIGGIKKAGGNNPTYSGNTKTAIKIVTGYTDCGCNAGFDAGIVLDPFMGAGTTAVVARKLLRNYIGFEINPEYIKIAEKRLIKIPERLEKYNFQF